MNINLNLIKLKNFIAMVTQIASYCIFYSNLLPKTDDSSLEMKMKWLKFNNGHDIYY